MRHPFLYHHFFDTAIILSLVIIFFHVQMSTPRLLNLEGFLTNNTPPANITLNWASFQSPIISFVCNQTSASNKPSISKKTSLTKMYFKVLRKKQALHMTFVTLVIYVVFSHLMTLLHVHLLIVSRFCGQFFPIFILLGKNISFPFIHIKKNKEVLPINFNTKVTTNQIHYKATQTLNVCLQHNQ